MATHLRFAIASLVPVLACCGGGGTADVAVAPPDGRVAEVITDGKADRGVRADTGGVEISDVVDIILDRSVSEAVDGPLDSRADEVGDGCAEPPAPKVEVLRVLSSSQNVSLAALASRPGGGYVLAANTDGQSISWDGQELAEAVCPEQDGCGDGLVLWLDGLLQLEGAARVHGEGVERLLAVAVDEQGRVLVAGTTDSPQLTLGEATLAGAGQLDGMAVAYDPGGEVLWAMRSGGALDDAWNAIAPDGSGGAVVGGWFESETLQVGDAVLNGLDDNCVLLDCGDLVLAGVDSAGSATWAHAFGGNQGERFVSLHEAEGALNVVGSFGSWGLDLGGETIFMQETICGPMFGCSDLFAGRYSPTGEHLWSKGFGGDLLDVALAGAPAPGGFLLLVGEFSSSSLDLGGGPLVNNGDHESFVARLDQDGGHQWSLQADAFLQVAAAGPNSTTLVVGEQAQYQLGFSDCPASEGTNSRFLAGVVDGSGKLIGHASFGECSGPLQVTGLAVVGDSAVVGGTFQGTLDLPDVDAIDVVAENPTKE